MDSVHQEAHRHRFAPTLKRISGAPALYAKEIPNCIVRVIEKDFEPLVFIAGASGGYQYWMTNDIIVCYMRNKLGFIKVKGVNGVLSSTQS